MDQPPSAGPHNTVILILYMVLMIPSPLFVVISFIWKSLRVSLTDTVSSASWQVFLFLFFC